MYLRSQECIERMAFDTRASSIYGSSYRNPLHHNDIMPPMNQVPEKVRSPPPKKAKEPFIQPYTEKLKNYKKPIDFTLFWAPKDIIRTHPNDVQKPFVHKPDEKIEMVCRTRPRVVMTPAFSLDDVKDPHARDQLIQDIYMTSSAKASVMQVKQPPPAVKAPLPDLPAPPVPIKLPAWNVPMVPKEWRMESLQWDRKQLRGHCEPDQYFWTRRNPRCPKCDETAEVKKLRKMGRLL